LIRRFTAILALAMFAGAAGHATATYWPRILVPLTQTLIPVVDVVDGRAQVSLPGRVLIARVGEYRNELSAYLMFDYLRGAKSNRGVETLLTSRESGGHARYSLLLVMPDDLLEATERLTQLQRRSLITSFEWEYVSPSVLKRPREQTSFFASAYGSAAARRKLEHLPADTLRRGAEAFVEFKSRTDPRIRNRIEPTPKALAAERASEFAADILAVAEFYSIPLDLFVAIGAMENNFMDVRGDLKNTAWKRRPEKGDVVLKRRRGRVLVRNESLGPWQITRETLRYAHKLYLKDSRDYSSLPERLRPESDLDIECVRTTALTTYAGLIFRDLLDQFGGDVGLAVGAYNGGPRNPNEIYGQRVGLIAGYFRSVLEHAAERIAPQPERTPSVPSAAPSDGLQIPAATEAGGA
jgi:hypothetical protein